MAALERRQVLLEPTMWADIDQLVDPDDLNGVTTMGHSKIIRKLLRWALANKDKIEPINNFGHVVNKSA